jgi:hypothetical protein
MKFIFYDAYWWELSKQDFYGKPTEFYRASNYSGGGFDLPYTTLEEVKKEYKVAEASDWDQLDWYGTAVYDNKYETGWLSPQGIFYGCNYRSHNAQAVYIHKCEERELEETGWLKLTNMCSSPTERIILYNTSAIRKFTKRQMDYLANTPYAQDCTYRYLLDTVLGD